MSIRRLKSRGIGRLELLAWLNELLETDYTKVEHLADGIAYCQVLDALHPGKVGLQHVNFLAKSPGERERNFRVLRRALDACGVRVDVPVRKLVDGIFQEHFELLHWMHDYAHKTYPDAVRQYQGFARRQQMLGSPSLTLQELNHANMNLVPSYVASGKDGAAESGFLATSGPGRGRMSLVLDIIDPEDELPGDLTLEDLVGDCELREADVPVALELGGATEEEAKPAEDPMLRYVENSHASTMRAVQLLMQLERTIALVLDAPKTEQSKKKPAATKGKSAKPVSRKQKPQVAPQDAPFLSPHLNELIEALAEELSGRAKDVVLLEQEVHRLVAALPETRGPSPLDHQLNTDV